MRYMIIKYVEAKSEQEAKKKARRTPIHEIFIHNAAWEKREFSLDDSNNQKIGFKDGRRKDSKTH